MFVQTLRRQHGGKLRADPAQPQQTLRHGDFIACRRHSGGCIRLWRLQQLLTLRLHRLDLLLQQRQALQHARDRCRQVRHQRPAVASAQGLKRRCCALLHRPEADDTLVGEQTADPVAQPIALAHQLAAFARQPPNVLVLCRWRHHHAADLPIAATPQRQTADQLLAIDTIRFGIAPALRSQDRGRIHHLVLDALIRQPAMQPEAVQTSLVDADDPHRPSGPLLCLLAMLPYHLQHMAGVARRHRDPRQLATVWLLHRQHSVLPAQFK